MGLRSIKEKNAEQNQQGVYVARNTAIFNLNSKGKTKKPCHIPWHHLVDSQGGQTGS